jgi:hypothetical protein
MGKPTGKFVYKVEYPVEHLVLSYICVGGAVLIVLSFELSVSALIIAWLAWTIIFYSLYQFRFKTVIIYTDRLKILFPIRLFLRVREFPYDKIESFVFDNLGGYRDDYSFLIRFKDGRKKRIWLPRQEVDQVHYWLKETGAVPIKRIK